MKAPKFIFYLKGLFLNSLPNFLLKIYSRYLLGSLSEKQLELLNHRVSYYNKLSTHTSLSEKAVEIKQYKRASPSAYYFDVKPLLKCFSSKYLFDYLFYDVTHVPDTPSLLKSRPINCDNTNSILLKLDKRRHFIFVKDNLRFEDKKDTLIWRGNLLSHQDHRKRFIEKYYNHPLCDVGHVNDYGNNLWVKNSLAIAKHFDYKFIMSIEGNDVATNLKWILNSNSLCLMCQPKYETWFMEGCLVAGVHYVKVEDDYSDVEEKVRYYTDHPNEAKDIIQNANAYVEQFKNLKQERQIGLLVLEKYFRLTNKQI